MILENLDEQKETRAGRKQSRGQKTRTGHENRAETDNEKKRYRIRLIPIWARILIILVLILIFFFIGAMIGYGGIGDGNPFDVFKISTWTHMIDIVKKGT